MPIKKCISCKRLQQIPKRSWTYLNYYGDWVCGAPCLMDWILGQKFSPSAAEAMLRKAQDLGFNDMPEFKSSYETDFADWMTQNRIDWQYERWGFPVGEAKTYTPDWYLPLHGCFLETKGAWGLGQKKKMEMFRRQYPEIPFLVVPWTIRDEFC